MRAGVPWVDGGIKGMESVAKEKQNKDRAEEQ